MTETKTKTWRICTGLPQNYTGLTAALQFIPYKERAEVIAKGASFRWDGEPEVDENGNRWCTVLAWWRE